MISSAIEYYAIFVFFGLFAISVFTVKNRPALLIALLLAAVAGPALKVFFAQDRPCVDGAALIICPYDAGLPSTHALISTVFAIASLGTPAFLFFAPAALVIGYSRIYLNVHSPEQVAAGFALGIAIYSLALGIYARYRGRKAFAAKEMKVKKGGKKGNVGWNLEKEIRRQALHIVFGGAIIASAVFFGMALAVTLLAGALAIGIVGVGLVMLGCPVPFAHEILDTFERKGVIPGKGAMHYASGCLLLMTLAPASFALAMVAVLAFGDGASTIVGRTWGKNKLPWNSKKSWAGTAAFFAFGAASAAFFIPLASALAYSLVLALIETIPAEIDDNLLVPVAAIALQSVVKALFGV